MKGGPKSSPFLHRALQLVADVGAVEEISRFLV